MDWKQKLQAEIDERGLQMKELSLRAGLGETYIFDALRRGRGGQRPNLAALRKISIALGHDQDWLISGAKKASTPEKVPVRAVPVRGIVEAGAWRMYEDMDIAEIDPIGVIPGKWEHLEQFAYRVSGPSMDKAGIPDGCYVICVDYFMARAGLVDDDIAVIERRDGQKVERTVKRIKISQDHFELWPESTHPRYQSPIIVPKGDPDKDETGIQIEVVGYAIAIYRPL